MNCASYSFFAAFVGWLVPFVGLLAWMQFDERGFGYITDFKFLLFWPLFFTVLGWLSVGMPIALSLGRNSRPGFGKVVTIATLATTTTFLGIAALFRFGLMVLIWWPVLIGLIGGSVYWLLARAQFRHSWVFWVTPILFFPLIRFVALPIGIAFFPYTTHVLGEGAIGEGALLEVIKRVKVGDTYEELHRRYPRIFNEPILGRSPHGDGWFYSIQFDDSRERVVEVTVKPRQ